LEAFFEAAWGVSACAGTGAKSEVPSMMRSVTSGGRGRYSGLVMVVRCWVVKVEEE
jgi:hypothetical protein